MANTQDYGAPLDDHLFQNGALAKKKVAYFYDSDVGNYAYVAGHPMKPHRIRVAHSLVMNYGCYKKMEIYRAKPATKYEMTQFHTDEYVDFLQKVTPDNMDSYAREQGKYNVGDDCPVFDGLFEFCGISAGGSMEGAARLNRGRCEVAVNWAGGLHHAKKSEASGFCYVNDIVLGIIELLRFHQRVLYIDIDVHHGDGVEEAFYTTDRVMTCSFHKYGEYFPGTGELRDIGVGPGKYYSVNFPLRDGITDTTYRAVFEPVIQAIMDYYQPAAVVLQCGGDSLSGDRLGCFNLSMRGHANCVRFVKSFGLPTLVLGGGGYTMRNVARTWAFETGQLIGMQMAPQLPYNDYYEYFAPDYELDVKPSNMDNANTPEYLEKIKNSVIENLRRTAAPSQEMIEVPRGPIVDGMDSDDEDAADDEDADLFPDERNTERRSDKKITRDDEFEDSDAEDDPEVHAANKVRMNGAKITDFPNAHAQDDIEIDEAGAPYVLEGANGDTIMGEGTREENKKIEDAKADAALKSSPAPGPASASASAVEEAAEAAVPAPEVAEAVATEETIAAEDMDIDQPEAIPETATTATEVEQPVVLESTVKAPSASDSAPGSPVAEPSETQTVTAPVSNAEDVAMADVAAEKEEGREERQLEDESAEKKAEIEKAREAST